MPKPLGNPIAKCVYVISDACGTYYRSKIGFSTWPNRRCKELGKKYNLDLRVYGVQIVSAADAQQLERLIHSELAHLSLGEEWFRIHPDIAVEVMKRASDDYEAGRRSPLPEKPGIEAEVRRRERRPKKDTPDG